MTPPAAKRAFRSVPAIVQQHVDEAVSLYSIRSRLINAPAMGLRSLHGFDDRIEAHLEGLQIAGDAAQQVCEAALERVGVGPIFVATARALETGESSWLRQLLALAERLDTCRRGLFGGLAWASRQQLRKFVTECLKSSDCFKRLVGIATCAMHRVDPGLTDALLFEDEHPVLRARAWRTAGELGKCELVSTAAASLTTDDDPACQFWASWSAVLLGDKHNALDFLVSAAAVPGPYRPRAFQLALQAMAPLSAHRWLAALSREPANQRWLIRGAGLVGDPAYVPWLIGQMASPETTRLAGEAFSLITGLDLAWLDLEVKPPENFESGPNDNPDDPNVDMDEDDGLPWPDAARIQAWWHANANRFQAGTRYFMGQPVNRDNCVRVLKEGFQRQRIAAALYLSLLIPGTPLFEWQAPARRQQRLLAEMN